MAFTHVYQPDVGLAGTLANLTGQGQFGQKQAARLDDFNRTQAQINMQGQQQALGVLQNIAQMKAQQAAQQQQTLDNHARMQMAQQQEAWNQQFQQAGLDQRRELAFAELDQRDQFEQMKYRPEADKEWQRLQYRQQQLEQLHNDKTLTDSQYAQLRHGLAQEVAGFNPNNFAYRGQFGEKQEVGDVWTQPVKMPDGSTAQLNYTRNAKGEVLLTPESEIAYKTEWDTYKALKTEEAQARTAEHIAATKAAATAKTPDAPKPSVPFNQYGAVYKSVADALKTTDPTTKKVTPADPDKVQEQMQTIIDSYHKQFGGQMPGTPQSPLEGDWMPGGAEGEPPQQTAQQQQLPETPFSKFVANTNWLLEKGNQPIPPNDKLAAVYAEKYPQDIEEHLATRYPPGSGANITDPLDIELFKQLPAIKKRRLKQAEEINAKR